MRRWALVVVALYGLALAAAICPILWAAFSLTPAKDPGKVMAPEDAWKVYSAWPYWAWLGAMLLCQAALLAVPVRLERRRPVTRGPLLSTLLASGLMMGVLGSAYFMSVACAIWGDGALEEWVLWALLGGVVLVWGAWTWVFLRFRRKAGDGAMVATACRFLLAGSILELLVAVPCHVWVRRKDVCCADGFTFLGIAMGVAVMLFSFGPGVLFLYAERCRRLTPASE